VSSFTLARLLTEHRDEIVARFVAEVQRKDLTPGALPHALLVDHIPRFLDEITVELVRDETIRASHDAVDTSTIARHHGEQRWDLGYDLEALVREYGVLRHCIIQVVKEAGAKPSIDEFDVLAKCLSVGVAEAATAYVKYRDMQVNAQRANLEFLVEAGQLLTSSLDYRATLTRLTRLLVPRLADWCAVQLEGSGVAEIPIRHVDASKIEVLRELFLRYPAARHSPYAQWPVDGEPQLVAQVDAQLWRTLAQDDAHLELLHAIDSCSWMVVPLMVQDTIAGWLTLGLSDSGRRYDASDLVLASELARRAAVAIDNARLYDLSQKERSRVEALTRAKDEFVAMISHELRTPLNAMLGWVHLLRAGSLPHEKQAHALEVIERNARAQSQLLADLLDISRVISGTIRLNPALLDMSDIVDMAIEGVRPAADAKRIDIQVDLDRESSFLRGDGDRLQQVVWNLLSNAVKFTPKNGVVRVTLRRVDSDFELVVSDNGEGIPSNFLPYVFDSFRQYDASVSRPHAGLGIGLSIVKHIAELHGGKVEAHSAGKDQGATFVVRLPVGPLSSTTLGASVTPAARQPTVAFSCPPGMERLQVLVVDDEADARELVAYVLEMCGIAVRTAASAAEALATLESFRPNVVISDIGMPDEDGYALIRSIRTLTDETLRSIPAIALTAFARNEDRTRALVEGFNMHLAKPVEPAALVKAVSDLAGDVRPERE
jgi:signal transduction histidine kinase/CheY-like chemotaxis protein